MQLDVVGMGPMSPLCRQWHSALLSMSIRHPNRTSIVVLTLTDDALFPTLTFGLDEHTCTVTGAPFAPFPIATVTLRYFPCARVAQAWVAAGWTGFCQHEALELVSVAGVRPIDPHGADLEHDRGLHAGLPSQLTPATLLAALCVVMNEDAARKLVAGV